MKAFKASLLRSLLLKSSRKYLFRPFYHQTSYSSSQSLPKVKILKIKSTTNDNFLCTLYSPLGPLCHFLIFFPFNHWFSAEERIWFKRVIENSFSDRSIKANTQTLQVAMIERIFSLFFSMTNFRSRGSPPGLGAVPPSRSTAARPRPRLSRRQTCHGDRLRSAAGASIRNGTLVPHGRRVDQDEADTGTPLRRMLARQGR